MKMIIQTGGLMLLTFLLVINRGMAQDERGLAPFDGLSVLGDIEVVLEKGDEEKAVLYASGIPEDKVDIFVRNNTLKLQLLNSIFYKDVDVKIVVTYRTLRGIRVQAGARVSAREPLSGDKIFVRAASGASADLALQVNAVEAGATEGAVLTLEGRTESLEVNVATGGQFRGYDLESLRTYARANTGGEAAVVARESLDASANTGGTIEYAGDPDQRNTRTLLSGNVRKI